jgi:hypothetical protein
MMAGWVIVSWFIVAFVLYETTTLSKIGSGLLAVALTPLAIFIAQLVAG